jgi:hypothetical protein
MSEHIQKTATNNQNKMYLRYGSARHHKHNKCHNFKRRHCRSNHTRIVQLSPMPIDINLHTGSVHIENTRKFFHLNLAKVSGH